MAAKRKRATSSSMASPLSKQPPIPFLWWIGAIGIVLFFLIYPYDRALFNGYSTNFESTIYNASIYVYVLFLIFSVFLFRSWKLNSPISVLAIAGATIPLVYWIASLGAVSPYYAKAMVLLYAVLAMLFTIALYGAQGRSTRWIIEAGFMGSGAIIVLFGLLNLFGQMYSADAMWRAHDGYRLTSVFQYSNTYAGYLIALFFMSVYYASHSSNKYVKWANAAMLAPIWISFMMTFSRGALVVIPVVVILILPFLKLSRQISYMVSAVIAIAASTAVLGAIGSRTAEIAALVQPTANKDASPISIFQALPLQAWGLLLLASAVSAGLLWLYHWKLDAFVQRKLTRLSERKWSVLAIPAAAVVVGTLGASLLLGSTTLQNLLPEQLANRLASINLQQHSVLERLTFYQDGLRASQDYPVIGGGGGAWQALYEQYQNNPYSSRQAHSFYVQTLVEIGWLGLGIVLAFLAYIYFLFIRSHIRYPELRGSQLIFYIAATTLLIHSAIDFDMSYLYIAALVFVALGAMIAPYGRKLQDEWSVPSTTTAKAARSGRMNIIYPGAAAVLSLVLLFMTIQHNRAVANFNETVQLTSGGQANITQLINGIDKSIALTPKQTFYSAIKVNWLLQGFEQNNDKVALEMAVDTMKKAERYDSHSRHLLTEKLKLIKYAGDTAEVLAVIEETLSKFPWEISFYEEAFNSYWQAMQQAAGEDGGQAEALQYQQRLYELGEEVARREALLQQLPPEQRQGRSFAMSDAMNNIMQSLK